MKEHFRCFAAYNRWANTRLYDAAGLLSPAEWSQDTGVFFKSMKGTLNHILVADRIWMNRYTDVTIEQPRLEQILFDEFADLRVAREAEDQRIIDFVDGLDDAAIGGTFTYTPVTNPNPVTQRLAPALSHLFNHQTHHRGHAHAILSLLGKETPSLDLIYFQRTDAGKQYA